MQFLARAVTNLTVIGSCLLGLSVGAGCGTRAGMGSAGDVLSATVVVENGNEDFVAVASQTREAGKWEFTVKPRNPLSNAALHFEWDFGDGETLVGPNQTYAFTEPGTYTVQVTGLDSREKVVFTLTLEIDVRQFNRTPLADAGENQVVYANDLVFLDGTLSQDDDGDALTYYWAQLSGPEVQLTDGDAVVASFVAPIVETGEVRLVFTLTVGDGEFTAQETVAVDVLALTDPADLEIPSCEFTVTLDSEIGAGDESSGPRILTAHASVAIVESDAPSGGTYTWTVDGAAVSGTVETHSRRSFTFSAAGAHRIAVSLVVGGIALGCQNSQTGLPVKEVVVWPVIDGKVRDAQEKGVAGVTVSAGNGGTTAVTDSEGLYRLHVPYGWSGTVNVQHVDYKFDPGTLVFSNVSGDVADQVFLASVTEAARCTISSDCDDGQFCNGTESCVVGLCQLGATRCPDSLCDESRHACYSQACSQSADCDDGLFCNGSEVCLSGTCVNGTAPCAAAPCDEQRDQCSTAGDCTIDADCSDGLFCNGVETCNNSTCLSGTQPCSLGESCDEVGDVCTATVLEGFGTNTPGGAGGEIYHITSLADSGPGTLRDGVSNRDFSVGGPRTLVFDVAGTITLLSDLKVREPFLTIDGTTAPSPGITIRKTTITEGEFIIGGTHDIIIRHLRFWGLWEDGGPTSNNAGTIGIDGDSGPDHIAKNIVLDHVTVRNATDSGPDIWGEVSDVTFSWCFFFYNRHPTTMSHYPAPYQTRRNISMHHIVYAENGERNPQIRGDTHDLDFVNNVIFNWGNYGGSYGVKLRDREEVWPSRINIVNNFFSSQNNSNNGLSCQCQNSCTSIPDVYVSGNVVENPDLSGCTLLSSPVTIPASARVTTYAVEDLGALMLPGVGMLYRDTEEQTLINRILVAMGDSPICTSNTDCGDSLYCNGSETCVNGSCVVGVSPCAGDETCDERTDVCVATEPPCSADADCMDSRYCNGVERCVAGSCAAGTNPCSAGQRCIEATDTCEDLAAGAWTPPIGIPEPPFGIHETVENVYGDPNYFTHYVDNSGACSDSNNGGLGSPAQPRCSIPTDLSAGQVVQIRAGTYSARIWTAHGTANQPVFIRGMDPQNKPRIADSKLHLVGEYFIIENLDFDVTKIRDGGITNMSYVSFRFNELHDKGGMGFEGPLHNVVIYGNHIHHIGDQVVPDDKHGITMSPGSSHVWIVDNEIDHTSGDGVQFCHGCDPSVAPRFVYIGRNVIHDCYENAVDFKTSADVIVSQNVMYGFRDVDTSDGSAVLIGSNGISDPARNIWVIFNEIFDSVNAIRVEASPTAVSILGNVMYDLGGTAVVFEKEAPDVYIVNNTVYNADLVINQDWRENFRIHIHNNIFARLRGQRFGNHLNVEGDNVAGNSVLDDNLFWQGSGQPVVIQWGSPVHTIDSTLEFAAFPGGGNNRLSDPLFLDAGAANFELRSGSPAIDTGNSAIESPAYGRFTELYGLDIRVDIHGNPRPQGTGWDLGAIESPQP